ncbi:Cation/H(+) antiporter 15 [Asimina triloba]
MATTTVTGTGGLSTKANGSEPGVHYAQNVTEMNEVVCYTPSMMLSNGVWSGESPMAFTIPVFVVQLTIIIVTSRILVFVLRPLRQPRVVSEILTGLILGPSVIGRYTNFGELFFPLRSVSVLETMANLGLLYFLFLVGVEMDLSMIKRTGKKALAVALGGMFLPFLVGTFAAFYYFNNQVHPGTFLLFVGVCLSVTAFPVLARILAELKLLNTDLGRVAISAAVINDLLSWILLALAIALSESRGSALIALWVVLSGTTFIFFCLYAVRPTVTWMIKRTPEGEPMSDINLSFILAGVMLSGVLTDAIGIHAIFGAFVYGLVIPNGQLGATLIDKLEDFVSGLLLPIFFAISGLRANIASIQDVGACVVLITIILLACAGKVAGTLFICRIYGMPYREGLSLGMLMNTKGLVEMIVLNVGREQKVSAPLRRQGHGAQGSPRTHRALFFHKRVPLDLHHLALSKGTDNFNTSLLSLRI